MRKKSGNSPRRTRPTWVWGGSFAATGLFLAVSLGHAEIRPSLNFYGATGLIDMPSGEAQPDGQLSITSSHFGPINRNTLSFQITPRLSASFRYSGVGD